MSQAHSVSLEFWFRKKYNLPPKDQRFLDMESWEIELEFLTYDKFERAVQGQHVEDYSMSEDDFKQEVDKIDSGEWEPIDPEAIDPEKI